MRAAQFVVSVTSLLCAVVSVTSGLFPVNTITFAGSSFVSVFQSTQLRMRAAQFVVSVTSLLCAVVSVTSGLFPVNTITFAGSSFVVSVTSFVYARVRSVRTDHCCTMKITA